MIKVLLLVVLALVAISPGVVWWFVQRPVPGLEGFGSIPRLRSAVLVRFDSRAVPYVQAESTADMYATQGYLLARERMFQMDMMRRTAEGRFADIFGIGFLPSDRLMRTIGFERLAEDELNYLSMPAKEALEAYCRGVNAYLEEYSDRLPVEFSILGYRPQYWRPADSLAILKYFNYELDESWKLDEFRWRVTNKVGDNLAGELFKDDLSYCAWNPAPATSSPLVSSSVNRAPLLRAELSRAFAKLPSFPNSVRKPSPLWGSTAWVISPACAQSGGAMLAADKHGGFTSPNDWYLCSLASSTNHVVGAALPGVPGIMFGRNNSIAWASSSLKADVQDLFVEHFDSDFGSKYKTDAKDATANVFTESIPVRFGKDVESKVTITRHGPVLLRDKETAVSLSWTGFETKKPVLNSIVQLNNASDWKEFVGAIGNYSGSPQLFVYADQKGNTGCHAAGLIPARAGVAQGTTMSEGWQKAGSWVGMLAFDSLPQSFNAAGSSSALPANFCIAAGQKIAASGKSSQQLIGHQWSPPYRANRLALTLAHAKGAQKLEMSDLNALQADEFNMLAKLTADNLKIACDKTKSIELSQIKALELMRNWDGRLAATSPVSTVYESFIGALARRLVEPKLGRSLTNEYFERWPLWITLTESCLRQKNMQFLPPEERTYETFLVTTFAQANTRLKLFFKTDNVSTWSWNHIHLAQFKHLITAGLPWLEFIFDSPSTGLPADGDCLNACDLKPGSMSGPFNSMNGPVVRLLVDMSDKDKIYGDIALGQSGHLMSPFRQDQLQSWLRVDPLPIAFSPAQLDKQTRYKLYISSQGYR